MKRIARGVFAFGIAGFLALGASCKGGGADCEGAMDKVMTLMTEEMGGELPEEAKEQMQAKMDEGIEECEAALEENPEEVQKGLDCIAEAESAEDLGNCEDMMPM